MQQQSAATMLFQTDLSRPLESRDLRRRPRSTYLPLVHTKGAEYASCCQPPSLVVRVGGLRAQVPVPQQIRFALGRDRLRWPLSVKTG